MSRPRKRRRANGEGSIYRRTDNRWAGAITTGFDDQGRQVRRSYYGQTREVVAGKLDDARKTLAAGLSLSPQKQSVAQFLDRWLEEVVKPHASPKSHRTYSDISRLHLKPAIGGVDLTKLSPQQVQHLVNTLAARGLSPATVKHCRDCLRAALNVALRWNLLIRNPATQVRLPRRIRRRPQVYNKAQARQFIEAIRGHRLEALFLVALCMGMREGELLGLGLDDLDLENKVLEVRYSLQRIDSKLQLVPTKTEESQRAIRLPDLVVSALAAHRERREREKAWAGEQWVETSRVFTTTKGTMLDARNMLRDYYKLRDLSGLPKIRFHDLRHSAATLLNAAGVSISAISKILGHASPRTTQEVYAHVTSEMEVETAAKMDAIFKLVAVNVAVKTGSRKPH